MLGHSGAEKSGTDERNGVNGMKADFRKTMEALDSVSTEKLLSCAHSCPPPDRRKIVRVIKDFQAVLFPLCFRRDDPDMADEVLLGRGLHALEQQISVALCFSGKERQEAVEEAAEACETFAARLAPVKELLLKDIEALYEGDPAAKCREEVMISYPGFYAVSIYRMAHELYSLKIPLIPRIMTEFAHEKTGIDIHPGATVGEFFCIDHGTGIVIGETTVIGDHVKLYQGVTLGAKSFELDENGNPVKNIKRHPNIGNHVVIYANATILGGNTTIGDNCVIGGNTWLTHSVKPGTTVAYTAPENQQKE